MPFWGLSLASLQTPAKYLGCPEGADLFSALVSLLEKILPDKSGEERVEIAALRMLEFKKKQANTDADLLHLGEAHDWMDKDDVKAMKRDDDMKKAAGVEAREYRARLRAKDSTRRLRNQWL